MMTEELATEVEALQSVYASEELHFEEEQQTLRIEFRATPRVIPGQGNAFVQANLQFTLTEFYPSEIPQIEIVSSKGLGEQRKRKLLSSLNTQSELFIGDASLIALCEIARDVLDEMNEPEGDCAFCMETLLQTELSTEDLTLCPCYHSFHNRCFAAWWAIAQKEQHVREKELIEKLGSGCLKVALPKKHNGSYVLHCPVCREELKTNDVQSTVLQGMDAIKWESSGESCLDKILSADELQSVRELQCHWKPFFNAQRDKGAFFNASPFVLSISSSTDETVLTEPRL